MKRKGLLYAVLSVFLTAAVTSCESISPSQENASALPSDVLASQPARPIVPDPLSKEGNKPSHFIASGNAVVQQPFAVDSGSVHIKLLMKNNSSHEVKVNVTHLDTGKVYFARTIAGGESLEWIDIKEGFTQGMLSGAYLLQWSGDGNNVDGEAWGLAGSDPDDTSIFLN